MIKFHFIFLNLELLSSKSKRRCLLYTVRWLLVEGRLPVVTLQNGVILLDKFFYLIFHASYSDYKRITCKRDIPKFVLSCRHYHTLRSVCMTLSLKVFTAVYSKPILLHTTVAKIQTRQHHWCYKPYNHQNKRKKYPKICCLPTKHIQFSTKPVVLKLCVATPRCVVSIFQRRRGIFWFCAIKSRFYCVKRTLIVDSFLTFF